MCASFEEWLQVGHNHFPYVLFIGIYVQFEHWTPFNNSVLDSWNCWRTSLLSGVCFFTNRREILRISLVDSFCSGCFLSNAFKWFTRFALWVTIWERCEFSWYIGHFHHYIGHSINIAVSNYSKRIFPPHSLLTYLLLYILLI